MAPPVGAWFPLKLFVGDVNVVAAPVAYTAPPAVEAVLFTHSVPEGVDTVPPLTYSPPPLTASLRLKSTVDAMVTAVAVHTAPPLPEAVLLVKVSPEAVDHVAEPAT